MPIEHWQHYRRSTLGVSLTDALETLITADKIQPQVAIKLLSHFDRIVAEVLREKVRQKMTFKAKGRDNQYSNVEGVWKFVLKHVEFRMDRAENEACVHADKVTIVAMDSKRPGQQRDDT